MIFMGFRSWLLSWFVLLVVVQLAQSQKVWSVVAKKVQCAGEGVKKGLLKSIDACAEKCKGESNMFIYGTSRYGRRRCWAKRCLCYCEKTATPDGQCEQVEHRGYILYKLNAEVPELCPVALPQNTHEPMCKAYGKKFVQRERFYYRLTEPNDEVHFPRLNQSVDVVKTRVAFSKDGARFAASTQVVRTVVEKVSEGLMHKFGNTTLKSYQQYIAIYNAYITALKGLHLTPNLDYPSSFPTFGDSIHDEKWQSDEMFSQRRLAGLCPFYIKQVNNADKMIGYSSVDFYKMLNTSFDWDQAIAHAYGENITLKKAVELGRLYVLNHDIYDDIQHTSYMETDEGRDRIDSTSTVSVFVINKKGELQVAAIQEDHTPDSSVYWPKSNKLSWSRVKALAEMKELAICQVQGHLYESHIRMEIICDVFPRHISPNHPLYQVFSSHCAGTSALGFLGGDNYLLAPGGAFDKVFNFGLVGAKKLLNAAADNDHYIKMDFVQRLEAQGLWNDDLKYYPYRDDGLVIWDEMEKFAQDFVDVYYENDEDVDRDNEIQDFANELSYEGTRKPDGGNGKLRGFPTSFKSKSSLVRFITRLIFLPVFHVACNYPLVPYALYFPICPRRMYSSGEESKYLQFMPTLPSVLHQSLQALLLGSLRMNRMFDYYEQVRDNKGRAVVQEAFIRLMTKTQKQLEGRNKKRKELGRLTFQYFEPKWITNSIHV